MTDIFIGFGHLCTRFFHIMPKIGNSYNYFMIVVGFIALAIWLFVQSKYTKSARDNGSIE